MPLSGKTGGISTFDADMKRSFYRILFTCFLLVAFYVHRADAQNVTGIWRGYFVSDMGQKYKLEFQIDNSSEFSKGVSYSYLDVRFYGKATMTGSYDKKQKALKIREIKTVEVKDLMGGGTCIMNYNLVYSKSGREEFLEGTYLGKQEVKYGENPYKWGDCGGGKVFLRRVVESDFYVEPFLKGKIKNKPPSNQPIIVNQPPQRKIDTAAKKQVLVKTNPPAKKSPTVVTNPVTPPITKPVTKVNTPLLKTDTAKKITTTPPLVKVKQPQIPPPAVIKNRANQVVKNLTVNSPEVVVKLYDNGEIDDDTISVYWDNKLILSSKRLTAAPLVVKLNMAEVDEGEHSLTMVAENLGRIPPNTSLMIVEAGEQRFDVRISSDNQKNAVVRFRYQQ